MTVLVAGCEVRSPLGPEFLARATAATSLTATAVSHSLINLAWQDNATNESGWEVHRSTTGPAGSFSLRTTTGANVSATSDGGLLGSTEYCYKVRTFRRTGRRTTYGEFSTVACATTPPAPVPAAPSGVNATPRYGYQIDVTWIDNSTDETGFRVERAASSSGPWTALATKSANVASHTDYVSQEQQFCYRVVAFNSFGESAASDADCTALPAAPTNLAAAVSGGAVDLSWTDNSVVEDGFQVERAGSGSGWAWSVIATLPANATGYHDAGVTPDNTYWYVVRATKDGGTSGSSEYIQVVVATTIPTAPSDVAAAPQSSSSVAIGWVDGSPNEQGFRVERSIDGGATWEARFTTGVDETGAWDEGLSAETPVCYRVIAFNNLGDSPASNTDCMTPPAGPTGFTATGVDAETVDFAWTDNSGVEDGYEVWVIQCDYYYYGYCYLAWSVAVLAPNSTSFRLQGADAYWYAYVVVAAKDGGYSDWSNQATPTPPPEDSDAGPSEP
ncbi:MAG: fibronectin type III domain-containing protein [Gemmatimonadetes bacterium]|nr:fibronectin type III domain-containing protein [Gemmatimonadota bacterium]